MKKRIINLFLVLGIMFITISYLFTNFNNSNLKRIKTSNNYELLIDEKYEKIDKEKVNPLTDIVYMDKTNSCFYR